MILVCGEALIDLFVSGASTDRLDTEAVAGGSPFNVAVGLARLQRPTAFLSTISEDAFGRFLAARLAQAGVSDEFLRRCPARTTLSVVATDAAGHPSYSFYAEAGADRALTAQDLPLLPDRVNAIVAGSYALGVEPIGSALAALLEREAGRCVISLDPNVRPRVVGNVVAFRDRFERLLAQATIVKASAEDVDLFYGTAELANVAWDWLQRGPKLVVFTRGADGPLAFTGEVSVERPTPSVDVVDTVGAGDTFHAGLLAYLDSTGQLRVDSPGLREAELVRALDFAAAAATLVCTRRGADPPTRDEVMRFITSGD